MPERGKLSRCVNCGARIFQQDKGWRDAHKPWLHYGYAQRECYGLAAKYATPPAESTKPREGAAMTPIHEIRRQP